MEKTRIIFISFIISSIFSISVAYPVIKSFGLYGVVGGLMATQLITLVIYIWSLRNEVTLKRINHLKKHKILRNQSKAAA